MPDTKEETRMKFLLEEYKSLSKQVEKLLKETDLMAKYALVGTVLVWTWLATHSDDITNIGFWWIPLGHCIILGFRTLFLTNLIVEIGGFIARIEKEAGISIDLGWEQYVEKQRSSPKLKERISGRFLSALIFWVLLVFATIVIPFFV